MEFLQYVGAMASELYNPELRKWKQKGGRVAGTVCSNIPEEVLQAGGLLPLRLRAPGLQDTSSADAELHRMNCSYTRSVLEMLLRGELTFLDGLVTTNTCDHMLRLAGELQDKAALDFVHYFSMYHSLGDSSMEWFGMEIDKLIAHIEETFGKRISDEDLRQSIALHNRTRRLMYKLDKLRKPDPPAVTGAEYMRIILAGMSTPWEIFNKQLEAALPALAERRAGEPGRPRLMLVGGGCDSADFVDFIESKGATVVADALCFGMRHFQGVVEEDAEEPRRAIAERYTNRFACPSIMNGFPHNYAILKGIIDEWHPDAVICARLKFCDHWGGHRKLLAEELRKEGLPLLDLEREYSTAGSGQISTRVQAFLEMLKT